MIWCEFDRASSLIRGNKRPTRCNRLIFIAKLTVRSTCFGHNCAHHKGLKIYTDGCCLWYMALWFSGRWSGLVPCFMCPVCGMLQLYTRPTTCKPKCHVPQAATICITSALLMMGITVPETCWADNKFCNKNHSVSTSWPFIPTYVRTIYDALQCKISISRLEILADVLIYSCVKTCSNVDISLNYGFQQNSASY